MDWIGTESRPRVQLHMFRRRIPLKPAQPFVANRLRKRAVVGERLLQNDVFQEEILILAGMGRHSTPTPTAGLPGREWRNTVADVSPGESACTCLRTKHGTDPP